MLTCFEWKYFYFNYEVFQSSFNIWPCFSENFAMSMQNTRGLARLMGSWGADLATKTIVGFTGRHSENNFVTRSPFEVRSVVKFFSWKVLNFHLFIAYQILWNLSFQLFKKLIISLLCCMTTVEWVQL